MSGYIGNQVTPQSTPSANLVTNLLINPNWLIDQLNVGALYTVTGGGADVQTVDGWSGSAPVAPGIFKVRRLADPDNAALKCLEITCTTADAAIAAADAYYIHTAIEGQDASSLMIGTSFASSITITFNFKTNVTGVYGLSVANSALNRSYVGIITVADTSEHTYVTTLTLDTTGTWLYDTGVGLRFRMCLAAGSNFQTTVGSWQANNMLTTSAQCNFMSVNTNIAYLKRIQLVAGTASTPFAQADIERELRKCMRYYEISAQGYGGGAVGGAQIHAHWFFKVMKRVSPTYTPGGGSAGTPSTAVDGVNVVSTVGAAPVIGPSSTANARLT